MGKPCGICSTNSSEGLYAHSESPKEVSHYARINVCGNEDCWIEACKRIAGFTHMQTNVSKYKSRDEKKRLITEAIDLLL